MLGGSLVLLGVGWSVALVAGSDLITRQSRLLERARREGRGEVWMGVGAAVGGLGSGLVAEVAGFASLALVAGIVALLVAPMLVGSRRATAIG